MAIDDLSEKSFNRQLIELENFSRPEKRDARSKDEMQSFLDNAQLNYKIRNFSNNNFDACIKKLKLFLGKHFDELTMALNISSKESLKEYFNSVELLRSIGAIRISDKENSVEFIFYDNITIFNVAKIIYDNSKWNLIIDPIELQNSYHHFRLWPVPKFAIIQLGVVNLTENKEYESKLAYLKKYRTLFFNKATLSKSVKKCFELSVSYLLIIGEAEIKSHSVSLRSIGRSEQKKIPLNELESELNSLLEETKI